MQMLVKDTASQLNKNFYRVLLYSFEEAALFLFGQNTFIKIAPLGQWIEDAYSARTSRAHLIENRQDMMKYNAQCKVCGITH